MQAFLGFVFHPKDAKKMLSEKDTARTSKIRLSMRMQSFVADDRISRPESHAIPPHSVSPPSIKKIDIRKKKFVLSVVQLNVVLTLSPLIYH